jgi:hypothetical protein
MESPKHLRDGTVAVDDLFDHVLEVFLAPFPSEKFCPYPRTEESGYCGSKFFVGHDFVLPRSLPHHREYTEWAECPVNSVRAQVDSVANYTGRLSPSALREKHSCD